MTSLRIVPPLSAAGTPASDPQNGVEPNGLFQPADIDLVSRVFAQIVTPYATLRERNDWALAVLAFFRSGITDEAVLVSLIVQRMFAIDVHEADFIASL